MRVGYLCVLCKPVQAVLGYVLESPPPYRGIRKWSQLKGGLRVISLRMVVGDAAQWSADSQPEFILKIQSKQTKLALRGCMDELLSCVFQASNPIGKSLPQDRSPSTRLSSTALPQRWTSSRSSTNWRSHPMRQQTGSAPLNVCSSSPQRPAHTLASSDLYRVKLRALKAREFLPSPKPSRVP